jgi:3,4-dihydroxy-9,10-secoandrosta-1,3,5(10)-triene-9,17-dione 4,5-dioxygenase
MNICALGYITLEATDIPRWEYFATRILGLEVAKELSSPDVLHLKMDDYLYRIRIVRGRHDRFLCAGWELPDEASFADAIAQLRFAGIAVEQMTDSQKRARQVRGCAGFVDPGGQDVEIFYGMPLDYKPLLSAAGVRRFVTGYRGDMGLGHIMGFGQTDYTNVQIGASTHGLHFLHVNNPRHHSLALYQDHLPHPGNLIHLMLEVEDLDTVGLMMDRVRAHGVRVIADLGRHCNDQMVSAYVESPAGFAVEFGFGGAQLNWSTYLPTESARTSLWGHHWGDAESEQKSNRRPVALEPAEIRTDILMDAS